MLEFLAIGIFTAGLAVCVGTGFSVLYALLFGLAVFCFYAWKRGFSVKEIGVMLWEGIRKVKNILIIFVLIGCLTGIWRCCGTIPYIVYHAVNLIVPQYFILCAFLLCSVMSYLTGTSFGTVSTMGVICMMLGRAAGAAEFPLAGAILSGCFFGDRCSPMSSSALLVADITRTDIFKNVKTMFKTGFMPLLITCVAYFFQGSGKLAADGAQSVDLFQESFCLVVPVVIPAVLTLVLCLLKVEVKLTMGISILAGVLLCITVQQMPFLEVVKIMLTGFYPEDNPELLAMLGGGGVSSMVNVGLIVCISASYSGIFEKTGLLDGMSGWIERISGRVSTYGAFCLTAVITCMISCNQSLAAILTDQMSVHMVPEKEKRASWLEDTVIVIAPLIPWSIAGAVPVSVLGTTDACLPFACYLYLIPVWNLAAEFLNFHLRDYRKNFSCKI